MTAHTPCWLLAGPPPARRRRTRTGTPAWSRRRLRTSATLKLSAELVRLFLAELIQRAAIVAESEGDTIIEVSHVERAMWAPAATCPTS
eukprot:SM000146S00953  [mRNA]  locus=s146:164178:165511:+ [translate_table: standard]